MGYGDEIMAAGHAARVFAEDPSRRVAICDRSGAVRWHPLWDGNPILARPEDVAAGEQVQRITNGVGCRPYISYPFTVETGLRPSGWRAADYRGRICLTEAELELGRTLRERLGAFVLIEPSPKLQNPNKQWDFDRWSVVAAAFPELRFVQLMHEDSRPLPFVTQVASSSFRSACGVLAAASAFIGTEGGLHHAAAALGVRAIVLFGGFISPEITGYPEHVNLADRGPGSPCGRWLPCEHCRAAMDRISVEDVVRAIHSLELEEASCSR